MLRTINPECLKYELKKNLGPINMDHLNKKCESTKQDFKANKIDILGCHSRKLLSISGPQDPAALLISNPLVFPR